MIDLNQFAIQRHQVNALMRNMRLAGNRNAEEYTALEATLLLIEESRLKASLENLTSSLSSAEMRLEVVSSDNGTEDDIDEAIAQVNSLSVLREKGGRDLRFFQRKNQNALLRYGK